MGGGGYLNKFEGRGRAIFKGDLFLKSAELSVSVFEICVELLVTFSKNIAKLLGRRLSINKMNVELEMKV